MFPRSELPGGWPSWSSRRGGSNWHVARRLVRDANPRYLPGAAPFNRVAVRAAADDVLAMADRLADLERPIAARGVLLLERLLVDGAGPLYDREHADELLAAIDEAEAAAALELP